MIMVRYTRNLFLRGMCVIFLFAFLSFYVQIPGLYGDQGILPAKTQLDLNSRAPLLQKLKQKPTLLWFAPYVGLNVEYMLDVLALTGIFFSFLGFITQKFCTSPVFAILWSLYFSIYQIGQTFMWFQWDVLLLEAGFLCIIIAPFLSNSRKSSPSDGLTFFTVRWLLFRLLFSTGVVKLASGCPVWWNLEALNVYFESQCLPTPAAWYAHHLPAWFLRANTVFANVLELGIPFLFFFPLKSVQRIAFYLVTFLQIHIMGTGNYNFYNLLTICLSISLLDDDFFYKKKSKHEKSKLKKYLSLAVCGMVYAGVIYATSVLYNIKFTGNWNSPISVKIGFTEKQFDSFLFNAIPISVYVGLAYLGFNIASALVHGMIKVKGIGKKIGSIAVSLFYTAIVVMIFTLSVTPYVTSLYPKLNATLPPGLKQMHSKVDHLHLVNSYGLFRRMTGVGGRPEVIIEGSNNIEGPWKELNFLYKPGNVNETLPFVAPHQPRLDWQMWFAALGDYHQNPWLMSLAYRLLNGQPEVLALLGKSPFRDNPPKYVRASLYHYHYTSWNNKQSNTWWTRERVNEYFPVFSRDHPPLIEYLQKMKILQDKPFPKVSNSTFKTVLDTLRSFVNKVEASILLWGVFTAGCAVIITG